MTEEAKLAWGRSVGGEKSLRTMLNGLSFAAEATGTMSTRPSRRLVRVLVLSTGLNTGGAERMLVKLVAELHGRGCEFAVVSMLDAGTQGARLRELGVPVEELHVHRPAALFGSLPRLRRAVHRFSPDVIQGWMYHGNLAATIAQRLASSPIRLVWGVRQTFYGMSHERPLTRLVIRANAALSAVPERVVYNSSLSLRQHVDAGFRADRAVLIPNGFETALFRPDPAARLAKRRELRIDEGAEVVGLVARYHPMKDHAGFLHAAQMVARRRPGVVFVLAGAGVSCGNKELREQIAAAGLHQQVRLLGEVADTSRLFPALDITVLSSAWGEAFPNVLGESLACAVPCVSTDVGDAADIIGEAGRVVPRSSPDRLAAAILDLLDMGAEGRGVLGAAGRRRVEERFSMPAVARQYVALYRGETPGAA